MAPPTWLDDADHALPPPPWSRMRAWQTALANWRRRVSSAPSASGRRPSGRSSCSSCRAATSTTTGAVTAGRRSAGKPTPTAATFTARRQLRVHLRPLVLAALPQDSHSESTDAHLARRARPAPPNAPMPEVRQGNAPSRTPLRAFADERLEANEVDAHSQMVRSRSGVCARA